jgi:hypothetical protein
VTASPRLAGQWRLGLRCFLNSVTRGTAIVASVILASLVTLIPVNGSSGAATPPGHVLNAATAHTVFKSLWPKFALAYATGSTAGIDRYVDTDVQKAIMGWFYCGCGPQPTAYQRANFTAPPERDYPLSFLAEVQGREYSTQPDVLEVVFTKQNQHSQWLIAYLVPYQNGSPMLDATKMNTPAPEVPVDVAQVGDQLAAFFQTVYDTGQPTKTWPQTGALLEETTRIQTDRTFFTTNHLTEALAYRAGPHSLDFAIPQGDLMCGEIRSHSVTTSATDGGAVVQPPDQSLLGLQLPSGSYSSVTSDSLRDDCWAVTPDGVTEPISFFGGVYSRVGVPAPLP